MTFTSTAPYKPCFLFSNLQTKPSPPSPISCRFSPTRLSFSSSSSNRSRVAAVPLCSAAKQQQTGSTKKRSRKKKVPEETVSVEDVDDSQLEPSSIPKPPAGFILDSHGKVLAASSKRIVTIVSGFIFLHEIEFVELNQFLFVQY